MSEALTSGKLPRHSQTKRQRARSVHPAACWSEANLLTENRKGGDVLTISTRSERTCQCGRMAVCSLISRNGRSCRGLPNLLCLCVRGARVFGFEERHRENLHYTHRSPGVAPVHCMCCPITMSAHVSAHLFYRLSTSKYSLRTTELFPCIRWRRQVTLLYIKSDRSCKVRWAKR